MKNYHYNKRVEIAEMLSDVEMVMAIDPALRKKGTGVAVCSRKYGMEVFPGMGIAEAFHMAVINEKRYNKFTLLCEYPRTKKSFGGKNGDHTVSVNIGIGLGAMRIVYELAIEFGIYVVPLYPKDTGLSQSEFREKTGYTGRTGKDGRCAGMMIYNYLKGSATVAAV